MLQPTEPHGQGYVCAILIDFAKLPTVDIVSVFIVQQFMIKLHRHSLMGTWVHTCGQDGTDKGTEDLDPFWIEVTVVWNKNEDPKSAYGKIGQSIYTWECCEISGTYGRIAKLRYPCKRM